MPISMLLAPSCPAEARRRPRTAWVLGMSRASLQEAERGAARAVRFRTNPLPSRPMSNPERWKPSVTVAAIVERDGRYLMVEEQTREGLRLNNPAGHLD